MTRIFNAYQSLRTWVVTHTEHIYAAVIAPFFGYFAPIKNIFLLALVAVFIDLITGVLAARKRGEGIESHKLYKTIKKYICIMLFLGLTYAFDKEIPFLEIHIIAAWLVIGFEIWSILENMAQITDNPLFRFLKKFMGKKIKDVSGEDIDESMSGKDNE